MLISFVMYGQNIPQFETTFYFEDAIGNKDSVILGYDTQIDNYNINENFGEKEITEAFDSVFEVRALHQCDSKERTSKKIIGFSEMAGSYYSSSQIIILARIIHKPLKVSYDGTKFSEIARSGSFLTHTVTKDLLGVEFIQPWEYFCMSTNEEYSFTFPDSLYKNSIQGIRYIKEIEGNTQDTLYGIEVTFAPYDCLYKTATTDLKSRILKSFPTIGNELINVILPDDFKTHQLRVVNMIGQFFKCDFKINNPHLQVDISTLPAGMYTGILNQGYYFKFIKL